jgi:NAD(P)-dependent dehydrogenase (short-subunit alcohol dehydrogenase family)
VNNAAAPARAPHRDHIRIDHIGHLRLTRGVIPFLASGARLVYVGSESGSLRLFAPQLRERLLDPHLSLEQLDELLEGYVRLAEQGDQRSQGWPGGTAYATAKMANGATTRILAKELSSGSLGISSSSKDVLVNACCPGPANAPYCQQGAHTIIHLATLPPGAGISGRWFVDRDWSGEPREAQW